MILVNLMLNSYKNWVKIWAQLTVLLHVIDRGRIKCLCNFRRIHMRGVQRRRWIVLIVLARGCCPWRGADHAAVHWVPSIRHRRVGRARCLQRCTGQGNMPVYRYRVSSYCDLGPFWGLTLLRRLFSFHRSFHRIVLFMQKCCQYPAVYGKIISFLKFWM